MKLNQMIAWSLMVQCCLYWALVECAGPWKLPFLNATLSVIAQSLHLHCFPNTHTSSFLKQSRNDTVYLEETEKEHCDAEPPLLHI
eukprot:1147680-Pelagomonas_calceolata.AAC.5